MWRCFRTPHKHWFTTLIFSTYVEVFPFDAGYLIPFYYFLHVCGGVSVEDTGKNVAWEFSPRMWRCFPFIVNQIISTEIFSTYVEVFLLCLLLLIL